MTMIGSLAWEWLANNESSKCVTVLCQIYLYHYEHSTLNLTGLCFRYEPDSFDSRIIGYELRENIKNLKHWMPEIIPCR